MKIIFLDFDGVLVNRLSYAVMSGVHAAADPSCVQCLNSIIESTGADIVVSSTWRIGIPVAEIRGILKQWGVLGRVLGCTPRLHQRNGPILISRPRGDEIQEWLDKDGQRWEIESFVILDDESDMAHLADKLVQTDFEGGLGKIEAERAIAMLGARDLPREATLLPSGPAIVRIPG